MSIFSPKNKKTSPKYELDLKVQTLSEEVQALRAIRYQAIRSHGPINSELCELESQKGHEEEQAILESQDPFILELNRFLPIWRVQTALDFAIGDRQLIESKEPLIVVDPIISLQPVRNPVLFLPRLQFLDGIHIQEHRSEIIGKPWSSTTRPAEESDFVEVSLKVLEKGKFATLRWMIKTAVERGKLHPLEASRSATPAHEEPREEVSAAPSFR